MVDIEKKSAYQKYITSPEWYNLKIDLLNIRGCKCEKCGRPGKPTGFHLHHLTYERLFKEEGKDLLILCPKCHMKEHGLIKEKKKRKPRIKVLKSKSYKRRKKKPVNKFKQREREANDRFIGAKRRRMKGKGYPAWMQ